MGSEMGGKERGVYTGEFSLNKWKPLLCFKEKIAKCRHILITSVASWDVYANFQRYVSIGIGGSKTPASLMWKTQTFKHHQQIALMLFQHQGRWGVVTRGYLNFTAQFSGCMNAPSPKGEFFPLFFWGAGHSYTFAVCWIIAPSQLCSVPFHSRKVHLHKQLFLWCMFQKCSNSLDFTTKVSKCVYPKAGFLPDPWGSAGCHILLQHILLWAVGTLWCWHPSVQVHVTRL